MKPFVIECLTCQSKLQVRGPELLGTIINCPSCQSMVAIPESPGPEASQGPDNAASSSWQPLGEENLPPHSQPGNKDTVDDYGYETDHKAGLGERRDSSEDIVSYSPQLEEEAYRPEEDEQQLPTTGTWLSEGTRRRSRQVLAGGITLALVLVIAVIFFAARSTDPPGPAATRNSPEAENQQDEGEVHIDPLVPDVAGPPAEADRDPEPAIELPPEVPMPPSDPPDGVEPTVEDPPGLVAEEPDNEATTDDLAGALRTFGDALGAGQPAPLVTGSDDDVADPEIVMPERQPIPMVDVEAGLAFTIADLEISEAVSFLEFISIFSRIGNLPITIDLDALAASDLQIDSPVQLVRTQTSVEEVLQLVTEAHQLALVVADGHLLISWPEAARTQFTAVDYTVPGGNPGTTHDLAAMLAELVVPQSWQGKGGSGVIDQEGEILKVMQTRQVHYHLGLLLKRLNLARMKQPDSEPMLPRAAAARPRLSQPISVNFARETPLATILSRLGKEAGMKITVNWMATHPAGWSATSPTTLVTDKDPLSRVLRIFLDSLELDYRVVDATTIQVSTPQQLAMESEIELHDIAMLMNEKSAANVVMLVQAMLGRDTADGLIVDLPSQHLLVRASQADQLRIHQWLHPQP